MAWSEGRDAHLAIDDAATGQVVGAIDLLGVDPVEAYGRFRFWVRAAGRRHGVARRALALLAAWARGDLGLERLEVIAPVGNAAAQGVAAPPAFAPRPSTAATGNSVRTAPTRSVHALPMPSWNVGPGWVDGLVEAEVEPADVRPPTAGRTARPAARPRGRRPAPAPVPLRRPGRAGGRDRRRDGPLAQHVPWPYSDEAGRGFLAFAAGSWLANQAHFAIADAGTTPCSAA